MTIHTESTFSASGGMNLFYQAWSPETAPKAVLAIVHGVGEHSGRYPNLVSPLLEHGFAAAGFDHRGHGRSPGQRGHINRFAEYREDTGCFLMTVRQRWPGVPVFLYGHSMGSLVVMDYVLHTQPQDLAGLVVSGTTLITTKPTPAHLVLASKVMTKVAPTMTLSMGLDTSALSRIPEVVQAYKDDPLVHGLNTTRWGAEMMSTMAWVNANLAGFKLPLLIIHGEKDGLISVESSRMLYAQAVSTDKTLKIYPGAYHEPHNDLCSAEVAADLVAWLDAHIA